MRCPDEPVLAIQDLVAMRKGGFRVAVQELVMGAGEAVAIVGPSGVGKSTLLDTMACVLRPETAGRFEIATGRGPVDVQGLWERGDLAGLRALRARQVGYVLQTGGLAPFLSIAENVALPAWRDGRPGDAEVGDLLAALGLDRLADRRPNAVSVGQRQRAAIARALVGHPRLILADEPTGSLDADTAEEAMALLVAEAAARDAAMVVVTHDRALAERHGLRLLDVAPAGPLSSALLPAEMA